VRLLVLLGSSEDSQGISGARLSLFHPELEQRFVSVSVPVVRAEAGLLSVSAGRPTEWSPEKYVMISAWLTEADVVVFAGEDGQQGRYSPGHG
jgi:hypothetical protein